jgi:hypothetical protein
MYRGGNGMITEGAEYERGLYDYLDRRSMEICAEIATVQARMDAGDMLERCMTSCRMRDLRDELMKNWSRRTVLAQRLGITDERKPVSRGGPNEVVYRFPD